eukprot:gene8433-9299_t
MSGFPVQPPFPPEEEEGETFTDKLIRRCKQEPLVPIGVVATTGFLLAGLGSFHTGNKIQAQMMMRGRLAAQLFTVVAMGAGAFLGLRPQVGPKSMEEKMSQMEKEKKDYDDEVARAVKGGRF